MKKLFQAVDIEKYISLFKKGIASLIILSMLMIDLANAMEEDHDPRFLKVVQRTPSPSPRTTNSGGIGNGFPEQSTSSTDEDLSPRSISPSSSFQITGLDIIDSKPSSDDSSSSPEKSPPDASQSLPIIPFPAFSPSSSRNITSALPPSSSPRELQPDFGTTPVTGSLQDRIPLSSPQVLPASSRTSSRSQEAGPSEKDPLLSSGLNSYGSSNSSHSSHSSDSSSDSENDVELGREGHPQPENNGVQGPFERFIARFASTQSPQNSSDQKGSLSNRWKSTSNVIDLRDNEILENGGASSFLGQGRHLSIQSQGPGDDELSVDVDLVGEENAPSSSQPGFFLRHFGRPFWPERPEHTLAPGALEAASQFLAPLRSRHDSESDGERSSSFTASSGSDSPTQGSPTSPRYVAPPPDSSESDGEGATTHLLRQGAAGAYSSFVDMPPSPQPLSPQGAWLQLLDDLKELSPKIKIQLTGFTDQIINGKSTWAQRLGKWLIGPLIGMGFAYGMAPVYDGGMTYLGNLNEAFNVFVHGYVNEYFINYINYSAIPDGISRNAHLWKKGISYLSQEKKEVGRMCIAGGIAFFVAFIPVAYLILAENIGREGLELPNWDNQFGTWVAVCGPPLYLDAFANDFYIAWNAIPKLEEWFRLLLPSQSLPSQMRSFEEIQREKFNGDLTKLKHFLVGASDTLIGKIYKDVQDVIAGARSEEDLTAQQTFAKVSYLLSLGDEVQETTKKNSKKSIAEIAFDGLKYTCLILGSPTVALLLQLVGSTVASLFTSNGVADSIGEGFALIAFLPFSYVLFQSMDNFKNLVLSKDPQGYESHPAARLPVKVFIGIQSLVYLFQTSIAVLQSYQKWFGEGWWPFAVGIPFFIPKIMGLAYNFNGTFNEQVTTSTINGFHRIGGKCRGDSLCTPCQKDWLIRFIESSRNDLEHWDSKLIHDLSKGVEIFKNDDI